MSGHNIYTFQFREMYQLYVAKAERKGRTADEVDILITWLTGYSKETLHSMGDDVDLTEFFTNAPAPNPNRTLITGSICGVKIAEISEPLMKEIRYLDKLVDELAKGKSLDKIKRTRV